ncbi:hypothetical protein ACAG96_07425 [Candidatus Izemoplasma sp. B36]|uniref:hypothetical protein n=1 Tax=Candidatus Izemoplasma sp. B36 TaxID=3242468 RepID=UPI003555BF33
MKKFLGVLIAFLFVFGFTACDQNGYLGGDDPNATTTTAVAATTDDQTTVAPTTAAPTTEAPTTAATNTDVDDIVAILNANSYTLTVHNASAIQYFTDNTLVANYGLSVTCTDLIMADVNGNDWVQVMGFATEADAIAYANHLDTLDGGEMYYRNGTAVLLTYSQAALDLFN